MNKPIFFFLCCIICIGGQTQTPNEEPIIAEIISSLIESQGEESVASDLVENFQDRINNPINLNTATAEEFQSLIFLSDFQVKSILDYIQHHFPLRSKYELQFALGLDSQTLRWLYWFTATHLANDAPQIPQIKKIRGNTLLKTNRLLTLPNGYTDSIPHYQGSPYRLYSSTRISAGRYWQSGITAEKDAGESLQNGFDFYSAYLKWQGKGTIQQILVGDFRAQYGQGLCIGSGFGSMGQASPLLLRRHDRGVFHYTPADENYFWRGAAVSLAKKSWQTSFWGSYHPIDAVLQGDTLQYINSIQTTGLHRTLSEIANRHTLNYSALGSNVSYNSEQFKLGVNIVAHRFSVAQQAGNKPYQQFNFNGKTLANASLYYYVPNKYFDVWGELATDDSLHGAMIHGISLIPTAALCFTLARRDYARNYHSFMTNAFGQNARPQNEHGTSCIVELAATPTIKLRGMIDLYESPWLRYRISAPSTGSEQQASISWNPQSTAFAGLLLYKRREMLLDSATGKLPAPQQTVNQQIRLQGAYSINQHISASNRLEISAVNAQTAVGVLLWQDISLRFASVKFDARFALFDTDWRTKLYAVEDDLKRSFFSALYYGQGVRWYVVVAWESPKQQWLLQCKFGQSAYPLLSSIGAGNEQINGNTKAELKALILYSF